MPRLTPTFGVGPQASSRKGLGPQRKIDAIQWLRVIELFADEDSAHPNSVQSVPKLLQI